jgi:hypothetical protein
MPVLSGFTVKVKVNWVDPVEAFHSPGLGSAGVGGDGGVGVIGGASGVSGGVAGAHPAKIMLTTITTVNKGMINFCIFTSSSVPRIGDEGRVKSVYKLREW